MSLKLTHVSTNKRQQPSRVPSIRLDYSRAVLAVVTIILLSSLLCVQLIPSKVSLSLGDTAEDTITARRSVRYKDSTDTELRRTQAMISVGKAYDPVPNATDQAIGALKTIFHNIEELRSTKDIANIDVSVRKIRMQLGLGLGTRISNQSFHVLLTTTPVYLREIEDSALRLLTLSMSGDVRDDEMNVARATLTKNANFLKMQPRQTTAVVEIAQDCLRPNRLYSPDKTEELRQKARDAVQPMYRQVMPGETVIAKGETVLQEHIEKFEALGLLRPEIDFKMVVCLTAFVMLVVFLFGAYLSRYHEDIYNNFKFLILLATSVIISTLALRISGGLMGIPLVPAQVGHLGMLWIVTTAMLISVLINTQVAVVTSALLSMILAMTLNNELRYASNSLVMALVAIYSVQNIRGRGDFLHSVASIAIVGVLLDWILGGIAGDSLSLILVNSFWAIGVSASSGMLFWIGTFLLERPLGKTTHISLLELADTNRPLLKRLLMEAPGTYTHSAAVAHLAETAADAVGADSLVARVGSFYHDIGKMRRPHFFIENQNIENAHDKLNPTLSALVITSHVKDGIEFGREFGLPQVVLDIVGQHHGNSLVQYFYHQATVQQDASLALEQQFRYAGPKPQTKEAAIVMLADSVEAARRSLDKPTPVTIELMVNRVVADKLRDGQMDESDLTFREVGIICACFSKALLSTMHARIEYPDLSDPYARKAETNASSADEPSLEADQSGSIEESDDTIVAS